MLVAIDTATEYASLALHDGFQVTWEQTWRSNRKHTVELMPHLASALSQVEAGPDRLSCVAVTIGPGSFTGLRVGMSAAKGLAIARDLSLIGVPTLDVLAHAQRPAPQPLCAILQAGRRRICVAYYTWSDAAWTLQGTPRLTTWSGLASGTDSPTLFCGEIDPEGAETLTALGDLATVAPPASRLRRAGHLAEMAWQRLNRGEVDNPATLTPVYLKHPT